MIDFKTYKDEIEFKKLKYYAKVNDFEYDNHDNQVKFVDISRDTNILLPKTKFESWYEVEDCLKKMLKSLDEVHILNKQEIAAITYKTLKGKEYDTDYFIDKYKEIEDKVNKKKYSTENQRESTKDLLKIIEQVSCRDYLLEDPSIDLIYRDDDFLDDYDLASLRLQDLINNILEAKKDIILIGKLELWNGTRSVHKFIYDKKDFDFLQDYNTIYVQNNKLKIDCAHHDGTNYFELRILTKEGIKARDNGKDINFADKRYSKNFCQN